MKVLVVDDDPITRDMLAHALRAEGREVGTACDGVEALECIRRESYRLVISDWEMPNMNGLELCQAVRAEQIRGYVYFIVLTRHGSRDDIMAGLAAGADDYVTKPFDLGEINMRIRAGERILGLQSRDLTIFVMARLAESRDPDTGAHLERVRSYSAVIARHLGTLEQYRGIIDNGYVELIFLTSPLHDIGKVGIPDGVLLKAGRLTPEEFAIMQRHTLLGAETLDAALCQYPHARYLLMAREIAASHHEHFDGNGYPCGLAGEEIPLCARIVALADVYDALTSKRVYKSAMTHEEARQIIVEKSGSHFDPDIVQAFVDREQDFMEIRARHADLDQDHVRLAEHEPPAWRAAG